MATLSNTKDSQTRTITPTSYIESNNVQTIDYLEQVECQETVAVTTLDTYANEHNMNIDV